MSTFFNNLKRKFTAPKTRHMEKKIKSMENYLGIAKKKFDQMQKDAEFYKGVQEELSKAQRKLKSGGELFKGYTAEIEYKTVSDLGSTVKTSSQELPQPSSAASIFLYGVLKYPCPTLENDEDYKNEIKQLENDFPKDSMGFETALATPNPSLTNRHSKIVYSPDECLEVLEKYEKFCRTCKQKIKDIFEEKKKQFSKEKTELAELSKLTKGFEEGKKPKEILDKWDEIRKWRYAKIKYLKPLEKNDTAREEVYTQIYELAKKIVPTAIENWIKTESEKICVSMSGKNEYIVWFEISTFAGDLKIYQIFYSELTGKKIDERTIELYKQNINNKWNAVFPKNAQLLPF
ncbi:MAG: hypothetical protein ACI4PJ_03570 [Acutalibacteraceae bacterium]